MNSFARCLVKMPSKDYRMEINMSRNYRDDFPLIKNNDRIYIDNAATSQKPECVIKAEAEYEKFRVQQDREYISQFDKELEVFLRGK